jgi:hypothetical protein
MRFNRDEEITKRRYEKPRLRIIELVAEEVLAIGCKFIDGGTAPGSPNDCISNNCSIAGS